MTDILSVEDHGLECIRKATEPLESGYKNQYRLRTSATGEFTPTGLKTSFLPTTFLIGDTASPLPATPLTDRNSIIIYNRSSDYSLFIGNVDVTADSVVGTTSGWEIPKNSYFALDIKDSIILYGIYPLGTSGKVQVLEVA